MHNHSGEAFLPEDIAKEFNSLIQKFLKAYAILAHDADVQHKSLWSVTPKLHYLWHLGARAMYLNPRKGNTSLDEDFMGKSKDIVQSCAHGTPLHKVPLSFMEKYNWAKHLLLQYGVQ